MPVSNLPGGLPLLSASPNRILAPQLLEPAAWGLMQPEVAETKNTTMAFTLSHTHSTDHTAWQLPYLLTPPQNLLIPACQWMPAPYSKTSQPSVLLKRQPNTATKQWGPCLHTQVRQNGPNAPINVLFIYKLYKCTIVQYIMYIRKHTKIEI